MKIWPIALLFALMAIGGCKPPPIAGNIDCASRHDCDEAYKKFNEVLPKRFPIGSSQTELERELMAQGFKRDDRMPAKCIRRGNVVPIVVSVIECPDWDSNWNTRNQLVHNTMVLPVCGREIGVRWSSDKAGNLTHLEGFYGITCL